MITQEELRVAILNIIQPLLRGKILDSNAKFTQMGELEGFDSFKSFIEASHPFGISSKVANNVLGYYLNMGGDALSPIIIGHQHLSRPEVTSKGEVVFYSTDVAGKTLKTKITLKNDGNIDLESIDGAIKVGITNGGKILLASDSSDEPLVLGNAFTTLYNAHTHIGNLGVQTGVPIVPMDQTHVSAKSFTEL